MSHKHISQLREVPELVFINCCHLSAIKTGATRLAADFGEQFIRQGVRAVVAAGWAVEDGAALHFADTFYQCLFNGKAFGDAVKIARQSTFQAYPHSNTWAAYQCYGDPSYRLTDTNDRPKKTDRPFNYASPQHLMAEGIEPADTIDGLVRLQQQVVQHWGQDERLPTSELCYNFADRYRQLGDLQRAHDLFKEAIDKGDSNLPVRAIEQRANLHARLAVTKPDLSQKDRLSAVREARKILKGLDPEIGTSERQAIMASTYKREAMVAGGKEPNQVTKASSGILRKKWELGESRRTG